jgi:hypothetical protein
MATAELVTHQQGRAVEVRERLAAINSQHNDLVLENGCLLKEYKDNGYYREDGFTSFDEAIDALHERGVLDYGARNARHFVAIVEMVHNLGIEAAEVKKVGVSKLREIASLKSEAAQRKMLEEARDKTVGQIQREAKQLRDKAAGRDTDPLDPITLMMTETQKMFYKNCIGQARLEYSIDEKVPDVAVLVDMILAEWFSGTSAKATLSDGTIVEEAGNELSGDRSTDSHTPTS